MQLFALDANHQLIRATQAVKQKNYLCLECRAIVRLRAGLHRQPHFYHLEPVLRCRQHQKGEIHLQLQSFLFNLLPTGDCLLECRFPEIQRIADVAWLSKKIIFEIQCSPIKSEEVFARNQDYQQAGWTVVWILHDRRFNQLRLSAAELGLRNSSHYFTNMSREGNGIIYDQFDIHEGIFRKDQMGPLPVDLSQPCLGVKNVDSLPLKLLKERESSWMISFKGDLKQSYLEEENLDYIREASIKEKRYISAAQKRAWIYHLKHIWKALFIKPWKIIFRIILEKSCR
jgi:competence protein CoiA